MRSHSRYIGQWYLAYKLSGKPKGLLETKRQQFTQAILRNQSENGSFRHPGWKYTWVKSAPYATAAWLSKLGYGLGWTENMISAHAIYALGLPKGYLPAFNLIK